MTRVASAEQLASIRASQTGYLYNDFTKTGATGARDNVLHDASCAELGKMNMNVSKEHFATFSEAERWLEEHRGREGEHWRRCGVCAPTADPTLPPNAWFQDLALRTLRDLGGEAERNAIYRRAPELHEFSPAQLAIVPPQGNRGDFADRITYEISFALSKLKEKGLVSNPERGLWKLATPRRDPKMAGERGNPALISAWEEHRDRTALTELHGRGVLLGEPSTPVGQYARYMAIETLGGTAETSANGSHHMLDASGRRLQIHARHIRDREPTYYPLSYRPEARDFDAVLLALFAPDYTLSGAWLMDWQLIEEFANHSASAGWRLRVSGSWTDDDRTEVVALSDPQGA